MEELSGEKWMTLLRVSIALFNKKEFGERQHLLNDSNNIFTDKKISIPYFDWVLKTLEEKKIIEVGRINGWNKQISLKDRKALKRFIEESFPVSVKAYLFWIETTRILYWT